jgi:gamma-glutamylaminecyclotransferase
MRVFVYGSLKKGKKLHHYLKNARFLGYAQTVYKYPMILSKNGWYPYLLDKKNRGYFIKGEVYEINYNLLKILDRLEEVPRYYKRKKIVVNLNGKKIEAFCYFYAGVKKFVKKELMDEF